MSAWFYELEFTCVYYLKEFPNLILGFDFLRGLNTLPIYSEIYRNALLSSSTMYCFLSNSYCNLHDMLNKKKLQYKCNPEQLIAHFNNIRQASGRKFTCPSSILSNIKLCAKYFVRQLCPSFWSTVVCTQMRMLYFSTAGFKPATHD